MTVIKKFFQLCSIYTKARRTNWGEEVRMGVRKRQQKSKGNRVPHLVGCHGCSSKLSPHQVPTKEIKQVKHPYTPHTWLKRQLILSTKAYLRSHRAVLEFTKRCFFFPTCESFTFQVFCLLVWIKTTAGTNRNSFTGLPKARWLI